MARSPWSAWGIRVSGPIRVSSNLMVGLGTVWIVFDGGILCFVFC